MRRLNPVADPWLWELRPGQDACAVTLLFLPHAGGSAANYAFWADYLPDDVRLLAAQYPGRGPRYNEPFATDMHEWVEPLARAVGTIDGALALFGHSLGALVGFELAWRLQECGRDVDVLFASAAYAPHLAKPVLGYGELSDEDLAGLLKEHGGLPPELLSEPEILELAIDGLRADLTVEQSYVFGPVPRRLRSPIVVLSGDRDPIAPAALTRSWTDRSERPGAVHVLPGGHFYLLDHKETVAAMVRDQLRGDAWSS